MSGSPEDLEIGRLEAEVDELRERAERAERVLAALRKPRFAVVETACLALHGAHNWAHNDPGNTEWRAKARRRFIAQLSAAVTAAEQEVNG